MYRYILECLFDYNPMYLKMSVCLYADMSYIVHVTICRRVLQYPFDYMPMYLRMSV